MDLIRRNTDYAIRAMLHLAKKDGKIPVPAQEIAKKEHITYSLVCKLLQKLQKSGFVTSTMGPKGGFRLHRNPSKINLLKIIEAVQGPLSLNRCLLNSKSCPLKQNCPVRKRLKKLQENINSRLKKMTLANLTGSSSLITFRRKRK